MNDSFHIPRLVVAGTASGVGKTTTMVALIMAFRHRGLKVACFKCGPDYLDPTYYRLANHAEPHNLDPWMMGRDGVFSTFQREAEGADIALIEGMMGLYDGLLPNKDVGSTAQLAKWLEAPVMLVLDASAIARSLAAFALGFQRFDPEVDLVGLWCNRVGSSGHLDLLRRTRPCLPVLGGLPRRDQDRFTERHLGLDAAKRSSLPESLLSRWGDAASSFADIDRILDLARDCNPIKQPPTSAAQSKAPSIVRIGVARDAAFSFYYAENLRLLEMNGAEFVFFSPITDRALPEVDALYLGGGYPELHAAALSENRAMRKAIHAFAASGRVIYAECGGFMYLTESIVDLDQQAFPMVGWFPGKAVMADTLQAIGYAEAIACEKTFLGMKGIRFRGHQFRYSSYETEERPGEPLFRLQRHNGSDNGLAGWQRDNVCGSYFHAHWSSNPMIPRSIVRFIQDWEQNDRGD